MADRSPNGFSLPALLVRQFGTGDPARERALLLARTGLLEKCEALELSRSLDCPTILAYYESSSHLRSAS